MDLSTTRAALALFKTGEHFALVSTLETKGSSPRHSGAAMLVKPDGSIVGTEQIVAPRDGGFERLLAQRGGSAAPNKQLEPVVEALDQLLQAKSPQSHGRKLDSQGDTIKATRELDHGGLVVQGDFKRGAGLPCALDE